MPKFLKILIVITLVIGVFFRFSNIQHKVYSADEVRSILRLSGYTSDEFKQGVFNGELINASQILRYQIPNPEKNFGDAISALAGNPEHPPLYHLLTRFWMQIFNTPIAARVFSIVLSIIVFPCTYWFCLELFESSLAGWIAMGIMAISPFQIHVAQNTTQYSLWTIIILASNALLLRSLRLGKRNNWIQYSIALGIGFYTHLFFLLVAFSHGSYVFLLDKLRITKKLINYCLASIAGLLIFSPWLILIISNLELVKKNTTYYRQFNPTLKQIFNSFFNHLGNLFIDFHNTTRIENYLNYLVFAIIVYCLYLLINKSQQKIWLFLICLIFITPLAHILPNFISPSARPLQARYYLPCYLGIQLMISYGITYCLTTIKPKWQNLLGKFILFIILSLGIISGFFITQINDWGLDDQKGTANGRNTEIAPIISQAKQPLVISEATHSFILGLAYLVPSNTEFMLLKNQDQEQWKEQFSLANKQQIFDKFSEIFIYFPDQEFLNFLETEQKIQLETSEKGLYQVVNY